MANYPLCLRDQGKLLKQSKVLARFDFNVPLEKDTIKDTSRIDAALPTLSFLLESGVSTLTIMSHLGRPQGQVVKGLSLRSVGEYLAEKLSEEVIFVESCVRGGVEQLFSLAKTKVILLENLRFCSEEIANCPEFAKKLANYGDYYINDAFGCCHRKHASVYGINAFFPEKNFSGFLLDKEIKGLNQLLGRPPAPFIGVLGGAKVSDKIQIIQTLLLKVDKLLIGGGMAYPFLAARGVQVGKSLCSSRDRELAEKILLKDTLGKILLPVDHVAAENPEESPVLIESQEIPEHMMALDIGPQTLREYKKWVARGETLFWNGPLGFFENPAYGKGTLEMASFMASSRGYTVVGGGDSVRALRESGLTDHIGHVSSGGGAALEFISLGMELPGIRALKFGPKGA